MSRAKATLGPAVGEFAAGCLVFPEGDKRGQPFVFEDWQQEDTDIIYEVDDQGLPMWKIAVWGMPTGNGKSPMVGVYANYALLNSYGAPQVLCGAAARKQAGIVHKHANAEAHTEGVWRPLDDFLEFPRVKEALGPILCPSNDGTLRVLSADGDLQEGLNPTFVAFDELHVFTTKKQTNLYTALATKLHKRAESRMVIISMAGESRESLLGELVDAIVAAGEMEIQRGGCKVIVRDYEAKRLVIWYGAPENADIRDPKIWRACNPASWITDEALRVAAASSPESVFRRYNLNQWVKGEDAAIQPPAWEACKSGIQIPVGVDVWVGVDIGEKRDTSAIDWVAELEDGRLVARARVFTAANTSGMETTLPQVEAFLRELRETYHLMRVNFDRWQMRDLAVRLSSEGFPMMECPQNNANMVPASQLLFDLIANQQILHDGDKTLRAHMLGSGGEITSTGGWRFSKAKTKTGNRDLSRNNDACIALAMAVAGWREDTTEPQGGVPMVAFT